MKIDDSQYRVTLVNHRNTRIRGSVVVDEEGFSTIYINARQSTDQQYKTFDHELRHIEHDDAYNAEHVSVVERRAAGKPIVQKTTPPIHPIEQRAVAFLTMREEALQRGKEKYNLDPFAPIWDKIWEYYHFRNDNDLHLIINKEIDGYSWHYFRRMAKNILQPWLAEK